MSNHTNTATAAPRVALYERADTIIAGDVLPDIARNPVATVVVFPNEGVRVTFRGTDFLRHFPYGGPDFGFPAVRIERAL